MEVEAVGLGPIQEADGVIGIGDGPEHVMLPAGGVVGDDAGLQLDELVPAPADPDEDGGVLGLEGAMQDLLHPAPPVLERRLHGYRAPDAELLHDVAGLQHVGGPLVRLGAPFQALDGQHHRGLRVSRG